MNRAMSALLLTAICLILPGRAAAICSSEDRIDMASMGISTAQIDAQCNSGGNFYAPPATSNPYAYPSGFQQAATVCVTDYGYCAMASQVPAGSSCECYGTYGRVPGIAR